MQIWWRYAKQNEGEWCDLVAQISFVDSVLDRPAEVSEHRSLLRTFKCSVCPDAAFASRKALMSHMRAKHKVQCEARRYAGADARCMCCGTQFSMRPRLIAHLTDSRRTTCIDWILHNCSPLHDNL
eukprot:10463862-Karenia_brevis.AAC.1